MMLSFHQKKNEPKHNYFIECLSNSYSLLGSSSFSWYFELMKKPYLLIAGYAFYPETGTGDWIECFETYGEVINEVHTVVVPKYRSKKFGDEMVSKYRIKGHDYDWYEIVDLNDWAE